MPSPLWAKPEAICRKILQFGFDAGTSNAIATLFPPQFVLLLQSLGAISLYSLLVQNLLWQFSSILDFSLPINILQKFALIAICQI